MNTEYIRITKNEYDEMKSSTDRVNFSSNLLEIFFAGIFQYQRTRQNGVDYYSKRQVIFEQA